MIDPECPKCGSNMVKPQWHTRCNNSINRQPKQVAFSTTEHLHYYCSCGFDFIKPIKEGEDD